MAEKAGVEQQEKSKMNFLTNFDNTLRAMAEIEGHGWMVGEMDDLEKAKNGKQVKWTGVAEAMRLLQLWQDRMKEDDFDEEDMASMKNYSFMIYGGGGWNRWFVYSDGSVKFSKYHADPTKPKLLEKVQALGFEIG